MLGTIFMQNLIRGDIDSVENVSRLTFNVPVRLTRNYYPPLLSIGPLVCTARSA